MVLGGLRVAITRRINRIAIELTRAKVLHPTDTHHEASRGTGVWKC